MKIKIIILLCTMLFITTGNAFAQTLSPLEKLDEVADEALKMTKLGKYEEAKQMLEYFSTEFTDATLQNHLFSFDELRILTVAHNQALEAVTNVNMIPEEKINQVTTFRLVIDALNSQYQPLWTELQDPIMSAFDQLKEAAKEKDKNAYHLSLNSFLSKYSIILPSLKVDIPVEKLQKLDTKILFIDKYRTEIMKDDTQQATLDKLETDLQNVFDGMSEDETDPSLWWVIISTGSIIILTLSYVGWRKYKGQKQEKQKEHND